MIVLNFKEPIKTFNDDEHHYLSDDKREPLVDVPLTATNNSSSSEPPVVVYDTIIEAFQKLDNKKQTEFMDIYIEMSWKSPLVYVALDQHIEIFERIGMPLSGQIELKQYEELCMGIAEDDSNKKEKFDFKIPAIEPKIVQRRDNHLDAQITNEEGEKAVCVLKPMLPPSQNNS